MAYLGDGCFFKTSGRHSPVFGRLGNWLALLGHGISRACARFWPPARSAWPDDFGQHLALPGGVVSVGLGHVREASLEADGGDGSVGEASQIAGEAFTADAQAVLVVGDVTHMVLEVVDLPMAAVERGQCGQTGPSDAAGLGDASQQPAEPQDHAAGAIRGRLAKDQGAAVGHSAISIRSAFGPSIRSEAALPSKASTPRSP